MIFLLFDVEERRDRQTLKGHSRSLENGIDTFRCIAYESAHASNERGVCLSVWLSVRHTLVLSQN